MIADKILGNVNENPVEKKTVKVSFQWFELRKKRISKIAEDGTTIGVCIPDMLKEGDVIAQTDTSAYVVDVLPSHLIKIQVNTMQEMGRLCFELGNRHLSLQINENEVKVPFDRPTFEYLIKLGFHAKEVEEQFVGFIECRAHGHSHIQGNAQIEHHHEHHHEHL